VRLLLDTHALLWWLAGDQQLSGQAQQAISDLGNDVLVSAASAWEIATKVRIGKLPQHAGVAEDLPTHLAREGFTPLNISVEHALRSGLLPAHHKDPFDRMLIAQAQAEDLQLVSNEELFDLYGVTRLW
jgi:PIN domain nuclease of toxin-antitoxin system